MKKILNYLFERLKFEIKHWKFYVINLFYILLFGIILLISGTSKYNFKIHNYLINALIIGFAIVFLLNLLVVVAKNSFLKNITKNRRKDRLVSLNSNDQKIYQAYLKESKNKTTSNVSYKSFYAFLCVGLWSFLGVLISYLNY
ncbi:hypothetical protein [Mycoplasmopsis columboralis]|uniref:DUF3899 domain-containing protein n=1 Tax=Mycoplasmopsis columboralis TaxID=171282 RepID=A0A449B5Z4_9BACT|nr:hypothetical protein [Mycoplasmopsis columboralis]VEU76030.1 Uncharacterised protein [Mycoplasmopsis columboralis]